MRRSQWATVYTVEAVDLEKATNLGAPIAQLTAIRQMHEESGNTLRREETTMYTMVSSVGSQVMSNSFACLKNL
jgi:hypothetical protein